MPRTQQTSPELEAIFSIRSFFPVYEGGVKSTWLSEITKCCVIYGSGQSGYIHMWLMLQIADWGRLVQASLLHLIDFNDTEVIAASYLVADNRWT